MGCRHPGPRQPASSKGPRGAQGSDPAREALKEALPSPTASFTVHVSVRAADRWYLYLNCQGGGAGEELSLRPPPVTVDDPPFSIPAQCVQTDAHPPGRGLAAGSEGSCAGFWESAQDLRKHAIRNGPGVRHINNSTRNCRNQSFMRDAQNKSTLYLRREPTRGLSSSPGIVARRCAWPGERE